MASLYVSYSASRPGGFSLWGWAALRDTDEPRSTREIKDICEKIANLENVEHVIPMWWRKLEGE